MSFFLQFGGKIRSQDLEKFKKSPQWDGKKFNNQSETVMDINLKSLPALLKEQFTDRDVRSPDKPIPILPFDADAFGQKPEIPKCIWYGHSALLLQLHGVNLLIDPMLGEDAAPIAPFDSKRFSENSLDIIDALPHIDALLMTHDHYDHLDFDSIQKLKEKVDTYFVALGVSRHLEKWGIPAEQITEFDWWDEIHFQAIHITFTPSRHFSGRGPFDRAKSLWGGWVFKTKTHSIYWSGDGGYDAHFKEIGKRLGPFDWGFMECGQYNERWHAIHLFPEESIQAAIEAGVKKAFPVHWGGFALALHRWQEPIERFVAAAQQQKTEIVTPEIGQLITMGQEPTDNLWWEKLD